MIIKENEHLEKYTTVKIGGLARRLYIPQNIEELIKLLEDGRLTDYYILSGGSNILMNDQKVYEDVIYLRDLDRGIKHLGDGLFYCGASCRIQHFIKSAQSEGYGGIEFLYSLPAMMGGIVYMNAGRGREAGVSISDYIKEVYVIKDCKQIVVPVTECQYSYRQSIFQDGGYVITGVLLKLKPQTQEITEERIKERLELCKKVQDHSGATFGSVFAVASPKLLKLCAKFSPRKGIKWSQKRGNWFVNDGTGTYKQAKRLIDSCKHIHRFLGKEAITEVCIWE